MAIKLENLYKNFEAFKAVDQVSFSVADGEFVTLLGPSGSGKSTVLRCIAGLEQPDGGLIEVNGQNVTKIPVQKRKVGFVFQHYSLFRNMDILDNVAFGLKIKKIEKKQRVAKARELLNLVGLSGFEKHYPNQLSGGQRQRVALARALAPEPSLLLLDEPFGALDARLRKELRTWLRQLHERIKLTSLMVTHDQEEALEVSDRILVMNKGQIEQDSDPQTIFNKPATEFVARFIGENNHALGVVQDGIVAWGDFRFKAIQFSPQTPVSVLFRPSDVYITSKREQGGWPGKIRAIQFLGTMESLEIEMESGVTVIAHVPLGVAEQSEFKVGKHVYVMITRAHIFPR